MVTFSMLKPFDFDRTEEWLDDPAPTMELRDPPGLIEGLDPVAGQQSTMRSFPSESAISRASRLPEDPFRALRQCKRAAGSDIRAKRPVPWRHKGDAVETYGDPGHAFLLAGTGGPSMREAVPSVAGSTIFPTVTLSFRRNHPFRTSPALFPPGLRTEIPRGRT